MNADQIIELSKLPRGVAAVYQNDWVSPVLCEIEKPKLKEQNFIEKSDEPVEGGKNILFDLLDTGIEKKLDDLRIKDTLRETALRSTLPAEKKVELLDFLSAEKNTERVHLLASMIFDYFKNTKDVLEKSASEESVDDVRIMLMAELQPSIMEFDDKQIDLLITLIMKEYIDRYCVDYPIWHEFVDHVGRNVIV